MLEYTILGPGVGLDTFTDYTRPSIAVNLAAMVKSCSICTIDYNMLKYYERQGITRTIFTRKTRHSYKLNVSYLPIPPSIHYSTVAAIWVAQHQGAERIVMIGFDSLVGILDYATSIKAYCAEHPYTNLEKRHPDTYVPINRAINQFIKTLPIEVIWKHKVG